MCDTKEKEKIDYDEKITTLIEDIRRVCVSPENRTGGWRIRNKEVILVFSDPIEATDKMREEWHNKVAECGDIDKVYTLHLPEEDGAIIYIRFFDPINTRKKDIFNIENIVPDIYLPSKPAIVKNVMKKLCDFNKLLPEKLQDPQLLTYDEYGGNLSLVEQIWKCKTLQEALIKFVTRSCDANGIEQIWNARPGAEEVKLDPRKHLRYSWHTKMWSRLTAKKWYHRRLIWLVDRPGGALKSEFCKVFTSNFGGVILKSISGASNIATLMHERIKRGMSVKYILIDLPKATSAHKIWDTIECLMDGILTVQKYYGTELKLDDRPRIIVVANFSPQDKPGKDDNYKHDLTKDPVEPPVLVDPEEEHYIERRLKDNEPGEEEEEEKKNSGKKKQINLEERDEEVELERMLKNSERNYNEESENSYSILENKTKISRDRWMIGDILQVPFKDKDGKLQRFEYEFDNGKLIRKTLKDFKIYWRENTFFDPYFEFSKPPMFPASAFRMEIEK